MKRKLKLYDSSSNLAVERFDSCYLSKVFFASERRNAWQWTTSRTYDVESSFGLSSDDLQESVESRRKQGSAWSRLELAALIFSGPQASLIVTEVNTRSPLSHFTKGTPESARLAHVAEFFTPAKRDSVQRFLYPARLSLPARLPFVHWKSRFRSGVLEWIEDLGDILDPNDYYSITHASDLLSRLLIWRQSESNDA